MAGFAANINDLWDDVNLRTGTHPHAVQAPSPWVVRFAPSIAGGGAVLDVAAGGGRHTRLLRDRGHAVVAVDRRVDGLSDLAGDPRVEVVRADLEDGGPWPLTGRRFAGIVVVNYLHRPILDDIAASLDDGGVLIYETFAAGNEAFGRPRNPDFLLRPGELLDLAGISGLRVVAYEDGIEDGAGVAGPRAVQRLCAARGSGPVRLEAGG